MTLASPATAPASDRVRLRRKRERGNHERHTIDTILDEGLIAHLGVADADGHPVVTPTLHARLGDVVYLHGSAASRTLTSLQAGAPACLTVSLIDGLVLARSAMHHSVNYRSVMLFGHAVLVSEPEEKLKALEALIEHVVPGRWPAVRAPTENELRATAVLSMPIAEASAKIRTGGPVDDEEDYALDTWAGVLPLALRTLAPQPDPRMWAATPLPQHVSRYLRAR